VFELTDERRDELVESWAQRIVARGLATPAIFLLEAHKPISGLGAQAVVAFQPLLASLMSFNVGELAAFMHRPDNVEQLVRRIEALEGRRVEAQSAQTQRRKEVRRRARRIRRLRRAREGKSRA